MEARIFRVLTGLVPVMTPERAAIEIVRRLAWMDDD
jgi:hypothetical protein